MIDSDLADSDRRTQRGVHLTVRARRKERRKIGSDRLDRPDRYGVARPGSVRLASVRTRLERLTKKERDREGEREKERARGGDGRQELRRSNRRRWLLRASKTHGTYYPR